MEMAKDKVHWVSVTLFRLSQHLWPPTNILPLPWWTVPQTVGQTNSSFFMLLSVSVSKHPSMVRHKQCLLLSGPNHKPDTIPPKFTLENQWAHWVSLQQKWQATCRGGVWVLRATPWPWKTLPWPCDFIYFPSGCSKGAICFIRVCFLCVLNSN